VDGRHLAAAVAARVVERELDDPARAADRKRLDRDPGFGRHGAAVRGDPLGELRRVRGALLVLDPRVQILGRFADDDQVDVLVPRADALVALARPHLAVEVERLAQRDVDRPEAAADRRGDRALEGDAGALDRVENVLGQRVAAVALHHVCARVLDVPLELDAGRLEHSPGRFRQLRPGSIAGDECHLVGHGGGL
jgi:hypothetical protein